MVLVVVVVGYCWMFLCNGGGSGDDSICIGGSCNSCRSDTVKCMLCGEDSCRGGGDGVGVMVVMVVVEGKRRATTTTIKTTTTTNTSNTTTKHSNKN